MDDVFGGLEQPEPGDFGDLSGDVFGGISGRSGDQRMDAVSDDVPEYATITMDQQTEHGVMAMCGQTISGHVAWSTKQTVREVRISFEFWTEGRGTTNNGNHGVITLEGAPNGSRPFQFQVPINGPMTYYGDMITLRWAVKLTLDIPRRRDTTADVPVMVLAARG